jgi:Putative beta-barrel porin 2
LSSKSLLLVLFWAIAVSAYAQVPERERPPAAPVHFGPLDIYPTIALTNLGFDNNVFNEPNQAAPKSDFTFTVTPAADLRMRLGRSRLTGLIKEDLVYYQTYANERSANSNYSLGFQLPLNRVLLKVGATYLSTRERPGFEIDVRSQRTEIGASGAVEIRVFPKTFVGFRADRTRVDYDKDAIFLDSNLHFELNRTMTTGALTARYRLTPLTSLTFDMGLEQDRFEFSPLRDSDSTRVVAGVRFEPRALIKGSASFGYRDFRPLSPETAPFRGAVGAMNLSAALGPTKLSLQADRDVQYSYEINQPFYIQTGATASITQHLFGPIDAIGRYGLARLDYQNRITAGPLLAARTDYMHSFGGGVGYRMARRTRITFNVDQYHRTSSVVLRQYDGLTFGTSVTYGF